MKKKLTIIGLAVLLTPLLTGCDFDELPRPWESEGENMARAYSHGGYGIACIDDIEYLTTAQGGIAPHLVADENDNPKVIKCQSVKKGK